MKSKLTAALAVAGCVLAVSPAIAISVFLNLGVTTTSVPGAALFDDFDSIQNTPIGTITGGLLNYGTPPATGNFIGTGRDNPEDAASTRRGTHHAIGTARRCRPNHHACLS